MGAQTSGSTHGTYRPDLFAKLCEEHVHTRSQGLGGGSGKPQPKTFYQLNDAAGTLIPDLSIHEYCYSLSSLEQNVLDEYARGTVFDVASATGRLMRYVKENGLGAPVGFDSSRRMRVLASTQGFPVHGTVPDSLPDTQFDTALFFGNGFGMPGTPKKLVTMLRALHAHAKSGARIIGESNDNNYIAIPGVQEYFRANEKRGVSRGQLRWRFRTEQQFDRWHDWYQYAPDELRRVATDSGWTLEEIRQDTNSIYSAYFAVLKKA